MLIGAVPSRLVSTLAGVRHAAMRSVRVTRVLFVTTRLSETPREKQNDNDDQDDAEDADATVTIAVAIAAETATEAPK